MRWHRMKVLLFQAPGNIFLDIVTARLTTAAVFIAPIVVLLWLVLASRSARKDTESEILEQPSQPMARIPVYLDAESAEIAARLGHGNVSAGIRKALKQAAASLADAGFIRLSDQEAKLFLAEECQESAQKKRYFGNSLYFVNV
jgi:hypothetical protein